MKTIHCPHCDRELNVGEVLGAASRGSRKRFSPETLAKLRANLALARERLQAQRLAQKSANWTQISVAKDTPNGAD